MAKKSTTAIDESLVPKPQKTLLENLSDAGKAEFFGFGTGLRNNFDVPIYIRTKEEIVLPAEKGADQINANIVFGLDRPNNIFSGFGGMKNTHCAAIDIVAGRLGHRAVRNNSKGKLVHVDPNFKLDAARIYLSQKSNPDGNFGLAAGTVGNTSQEDPRSTVALKADTIRIVARENIKFVTRTDTENSQGGNTDNTVTSGYGIDLIAMNDDTDMQPLVKGQNLQRCLKEMLEATHDLRELFKNFLEYNRTFTQAIMSHTHYSPFQPSPGAALLTTAPDFTQLIPQGIETLVNNVTNVESQLMLQMQKMNAIEQNYLDAPGGAEAVENGKGLFILSKFNNTN